MHNELHERMAMAKKKLVIVFRIRHVHRARRIPHAILNGPLSALQCFIHTVTFR